MMAADVIDLGEPLPGINTIKEVAYLLRVSERTVREEIRRRRLAACHVGREWRITDDQLRAYLEGRS